MNVFCFYLPRCQGQNVRINSISQLVFCTLITEDRILEITGSNSFHALSLVSVRSRMAVKLKREEFNNLKLQEIIDWERRDDGLLYFLVKMESETKEGKEFQPVWLPIHIVPQYFLRKYFKEVEETSGSHVFQYASEDEERENKVKVLKNLTYSLFKNETFIITELFIAKENPMFFELRARANDLEKRLADLPEYSNSNSDEMRSLLIDVIIQNKNLITEYEPVKIEDLIKMEAEINMISNDKKPILLSRNIRQVDVRSLKNTHYVNTVLIPPSLAGLDLMKKRVSCLCTTDECQLSECSHYENTVPAYDINGRLVEDYFKTESIHKECNSSCSERTKTIHECNSGCRCGPSCPNRVVQNGSAVQKEIFSTVNGYGVGLGVRTLEKVKKGSFIGTYAGKLITGEESRHLRGNQYLFEVTSSELPCSSKKVHFIQPTTKKCADYVIDAHRYGNITRLMNHSCAPNVMTFYAHIEISDPRVHDIVFFAQRDIDKGEELCIHYGPRYFQKKDKCFCVVCINSRKKVKKEDVQEH